MAESPRHSGPGMLLGSKLTHPDPHPMNNPPSSPPKTSSLIYRWLWILAIFLTLGGVAHAEIAEKVAARMQKSTVRVVILKGDKVMGHGSGFIISSQGHVATNCGRRRERRIERAV